MSDSIEIRVERYRTKEEHKLRRYFTRTITGVGIITLSAIGLASEIQPSKDFKENPAIIQESQIINNTLRYTSYGGIAVGIGYCGLGLVGMIRTGRKQKRNMLERTIDEIPSK